MRKFFYYLLPACLFSTFVFLSCSSGIQKTGEVSLEISSASLSRLAARDAASDAKADYTIKVKLTAESDTQEQTVNLANNKNTASISFSDLTIGETAKVEAWLYYGSNLISTGSSDSFTIKEGSNPVTIRLTLNGDKTEVHVAQNKRHFTIRTITGTSTTFYSVSGGEIVFSLFDEDGNDVLEGIDWDREASQSVWKYEVEIYSDSGTLDNDWIECEKNMIRINTFGSSGTYFVTVTVSPLSRTYETSSSDIIEIPDFEPFSETFEIYAEYSV